MVDLPSFENPPVQSVQITVALSERLGLSDLFDFYRAGLAESYPVMHERAAHEPTREAPWDHDGRITIDMSGVVGAPNVQLHAHSASSEWHVQLQQDWIAVTWKLIRGGAYPRWGDVRQRFSDVLTPLATKVPLRIDQADVCYRNALEQDAAADVVSMQSVAAGLGSIESLRFHSHHQVMLGSSFGRMHLDIGPVKGGSINWLGMSLTARAKPDGESIDSALLVCDSAHVEIVKGFKAITTEKYHAIWGEQA